MFLISSPCIQTIYLTYWDQTCIKNVFEANMTAQKYISNFFKSKHILGKHNVILNCVSNKGSKHFFTIFLKNTIRNLQDLEYSHFQPLRFALKDIESKKSVIVTGTTNLCIVSIH